MYKITTQFVAITDFFVSTALIMENKTKYNVLTIPQLKNNPEPTFVQYHLFASFIAININQNHNATNTGMGEYKRHTKLLKRRNLPNHTHHRKYEQGGTFKKRVSIPYISIQHAE